MRKKIVAGNWKMNTKPSQGDVLVKEILSLDRPSDVQLIVAPPYTHINSVANLIDGSDLLLASQNIAKEPMGAYTGEISGEMLNELGVAYSIIGHSERRSYYGETNEIVALKIKNALKHNINPIFCVGEVLEEREAGKHFDVIKEQMTFAISKLESQEMKQVVIAYEPVWAIGTGKTATPDQAQEVHAFIRGLVKQIFGGEIAENISILYGGSCKPSNAKELFAKADIDGGLIGGAALVAQDFVSIAQSF
jgi:triosephosphate isomerase